jgi:penicillin-binding protein 2D
MSSRRARAKRQRHTLRIFLRVVGVLVAVSIVMTVGATAIGYATVQSWLKDLPDANAIKVAEATKVYSADGVLLARLYLENREVVPIESISPFLRGAVIAVEDERFYEHEGYDTVGILRAAVKNVSAGGVQEGASTLTQQYIRQTLLSHEATQITIARKIREIYLAQELEKRHTKDQILAMYLNTVYFGDGAYGAEAASKDLFAKPARKLTLAQAAMIAGLPQSPYRLNPWNKANKTRAITRQRWVLAKMLEQGKISPDQYQEAYKEKLVFNRAPEPTDGTMGKAPYFVAYVKKLLQDKFTSGVVFKGGLRVYTTIDTRMQAEAERARDKELNQPGDPACALVSIDPKTGFIKAMVGGTDFNRSKFNLATQGKRQPGSSFKTFVLVTALEKGIPPYRAFNSDSPVTIYPGHGAPPWTVYNSEGKGEGMISLEKATQNSVNAVYARLAEELGAADIASTAKRMGITTAIPNNLSIALGSENCTPLEMASAYGTLANNGVHNPSVAITKVVGPDGKVMLDWKPKAKQAISREIAYATTQVLQHVIWSGTGTAADIGRDAAGKTGTSQNYRDAWFVGYTPQLVTSVWVGYTVERPMTDVHGERGFGGTLAAPIWATYMNAVLHNLPKVGFSGADRPDYVWKDGWQHEPPPKPKVDPTKKKTTTTTTKKPTKKPTKPVTPPPVTPPSGDGTPTP